MIDARGIEAAFNRFVTPEHVLVLAGYSPLVPWWTGTLWVLRLPSGRWQAMARISGRTVRIKARGFAFTGQQTWHSQAGYFTFSEPMSAWQAFCGLVARHDHAAALRKALRIPAVRSALSSQLGELIHAA